MENVGSLAIRGEHEAVCALLGALGKARLGFRNAAKDSTGQAGPARFQYADLGSLTEATEGALAGAGVTLVTFPTGSVEDGLRVDWVLSGHGASIWGQLQLPQFAVNEIKLAGGYLTYLRRYTVAAITNVIQGEENPPELDDRYPGPNFGGRPQPPRHAAPDAPPVKRGPGRPPKNRDAEPPPPPARPRSEPPPPPVRRAPELEPAPLAEELPEPVAAEVMPDVPMTAETRSRIIEGTRVRGIRRDAIVRRFAELGAEDPNRPCERIARIVADEIDGV